jgi:Na+-transporting methylmalonyl-CoA/oxaloacetate decarboxylase beta subunit
MYQSRHLTAQGVIFSKCIYHFKGLKDINAAIGVAAGEGAAPIAASKIQRN